MNTRAISEHTHRLNHQGAIWWTDYKAVRWWEDHAQWVIRHTTQRHVLSTFRTLNPEHTILKSATYQRVICTFDVSCFDEDPDLMYADRGRLDYRVSISGGSLLAATSGDQVHAQRQILDKIAEVVAWLETDPVIDGEHLSARRWDVVAQALLSREREEVTTAKARAADPAFSRAEADEIITTMKERAGDNWSVSLDLVGRAGGDFGTRGFTLRAKGSAVRSTGYGGGYTTRAKFTISGGDVSQAVVRTLLMESVSKKYNSDWRSKLR